MKHGVALSIGSSFLFATLYYYATLLEPLAGEQIFAWRVVLGIPALALVMTRLGGWKEMRTVSRRLLRRRDWRAFGALALAAGLIGMQLWLFVWAPLHQRALDVSLGYFLLPLMMVLIGRVFYRERLSRAQAYAVGIAAIGVAHEVWLVGGISWATALVVFGYPPYFMLRRALKIGALASLWFDMMFILPFAVLILATQDVSVLDQVVGAPRLLFLVPLMGLISSLALVGYIGASRILPLGLFGILSYVEPVLLFWVALLALKEPVSGQAWFTYIPIWIAIGLVAGEGALKLRGRRRGARASRRSK